MTSCHMSVWHLFKRKMEMFPRISSQRLVVVVLTWLLFMSWPDSLTPRHPFISPLPRLAYKHTIYHALPPVNLATHCHCHPISRVEINNGIWQHKEAICHQEKNPDETSDNHYLSFSASVREEVSWFLPKTHLLPSASLLPPVSCLLVSPPWPPPAPLSFCMSTLRNS